MVEQQPAAQQESAVTESTANVEPTKANQVRPATSTKTKRRRTVVWSVNVFTVVLYMVDPRYMLCQSKYKQVSKRFKKALEIVLRVVVHEASQYIEYSAPLVMDLERQYLQSDAFTSLRRIWTSLRGCQNDKLFQIGADKLKEKKLFSIMALTAAMTSISDETAYYDDSLPNFDRSTIENILMCQASDKDDMQKLNKLFKKMCEEATWRAQACQKYLMTEQKLQDDEHRMYPEYLELLPWILTSLPVDLDTNRVPTKMSTAYTIFYEYVQTLVNYHNDRGVQNIRSQVMRRRLGMKSSQERMAFMLRYEGLRTMHEMQVEEKKQAAQSMQEMKDRVIESYQSEKTQPDGSPVTLIDLLYQKRYAEREYDSDYYESDYYYSEEGSDSEESEEEDDYDDEYDDEESKVDPDDLDTQSMISKASKKKKSKKTTSTRREL